jgi:hypothetical protein
LSLGELPKFDARSLEVLRQPMEDKRVTISRASGTLTFPANFMRVAAMAQLQMSARAFHRALAFGGSRAPSRTTLRLRSGHAYGQRGDQGRRRIWQAEKTRGIE